MQGLFPCNTSLDLEHPHSGTKAGLELKAAGAHRTSTLNCNAHPKDPNITTKLPIQLPENHDLTISPHDLKKTPEKFHSN